MSIQWLEVELRRKAIEDPKADAWADVIVAMKQSLGYDIPMPVPVLETPPLKPRDRINKIFSEYNRKHYDIEQVSKVWTELWKVWGEQLDIQVTVPPCNRTQEELKALAQQGRIMLYVPEKLSGQTSRSRLSELYPELMMPNYSNAENTVDQHGWLDVELTIFDMANPNLTEEGADSLFKSQDKTGQTLNTYMIGSVFNYNVTGRYYDEFYSYSRLLSTKDQGKVLYVGFQGPLGMYIETDPNRMGLSGDAWRENHGSKDPNVGARSAGIKRAA